VNANPAVENQAVQGVRLIEPAPEMAVAYRGFLQEFIDAGEEGILDHMPDEIEDAAECIRRLKDHALGVNLPDGWVTCTAYWLVSGERLVGEIHIRHRLTPALEDYGGHIGYMVRPCERGKGHGTRMLALGLGKVRAMGLYRVLVTCAPENAASARVIRKNGGKLISESVARVGRITSRYWIDL